MEKRQRKEEKPLKEYLFSNSKLLLSELFFKNEHFTWDRIETEDTEWKEESNLSTQMHHKIENIINTDVPITHFHSTRKDCCLLTLHMSSGIFFFRRHTEKTTNYFSMLYILAWAGYHAIKNIPIFQWLHPFTTCNGYKPHQLDLVLSFGKTNTILGCINRGI